MGDLVKFDGRIGRRTFWKYFALLTFGYIIASVFWSASIDTFTGQPGGGMLFIGIVIWLALIPMNFSILMRRWHDLDRSGWWILVGFVPFIGALYSLIMLGFIAGDDGPNQYGNPEGYLGPTSSPYARSVSAD